MIASMTDGQDRIDSEASGWLVRLENGAPGPDERAEFEEWLALDPRHRKTFEGMRQTWNEVPQLASLAYLVTKPGLSASEPVSARAPLHRHWARWSAGGLAAAAAAFAALLWVPGSWLSPGNRYSTQIAETRIVTLADGSSVTLGGKSSLLVRFSEKERRVILSGGEAFFDVVHNGARPFVVEAGNSLIRDVGTKFDVNVTHATVRVSVVEGLVQVSSPDRSRGPAKLIRAGEGTEISLAPPGNNTTEPLPVLSSRDLPAGAWREGRLVFDDVRLADMAADVNRYYVPGVKVDPGEVGDLRVTASFKTSEIPAFMSALSATLPVRAEQEPNGSFTIHASKS